MHSCSGICGGSASPWPGQKIWQKTNTMTMTGGCKTVGIWGRLTLPQELFTWFSHESLFEETKLAFFLRNQFSSWAWMRLTKSLQVQVRTDLDQCGTIDAGRGGEVYWEPGPCQGEYEMLLAERGSMKTKLDRLIEERSRLDERLSSVKSQRASGEQSWSWTGNWSYFSFCLIILFALIILYAFTPKCHGDILKPNPKT